MAVKGVYGSLRDEDFQDKLLEELNPIETKRLISIITELVEHGHTDLYISGAFEEHHKYIHVYDGDRPEVEDGGCFYKPGLLGGYYLSSI